MTEPCIWVVVCSAQRMIPLAELAERIRGKREVLGVDIGETLLVHTVDGSTGSRGRIVVTIAKDPLSRADLDEIAARRPPPREVAEPSPTAYYELRWELSESHEVYNILMVIAEELEAQCDGVTYDVTNARFV